MNSDKSFFLDSARWISSLFVLFGHSQLIGGWDGLHYLTTHAHAAVVMFFVLSGYVIAYTVEEKRYQKYSLKNYYFDRFSRIYSVLFPALLLTIILDAIGVKLFPARYLDPNLLPQDMYFIRLLINFFSLQGIWGYRVQFGSNPALWSIGYEFCYYTLYGLFVWRPKKWYLYSILIMIVIGPKILIYGFIWLLGILAFNLNRIWNIKSNFLLSLFFLVISNYLLQYGNSYLSEFWKDFIFGLAAMMLIMSNPIIPMKKYLLKFNRQMADFSYSSYAYHYPFMFMFYAFFASTETTFWFCIAFSLVVARLLYQITEKKRATLKLFLLKVT